MKPQDRYWDSTVFLAYFNEEEGRVDLCDAIIEKAKAGEIRIITSTVTLCEVVWIRGREKMTSDKQLVMENFFAQDFIVLVELTRMIAETARELVWTHPGLKPKDSIHVASAMFAESKIIDAFDDDFHTLNGSIKTRGGHLIRIGKPDIPPQQRLVLPNR